MVPANSDRIPRVPPYSGGGPLDKCLPVPDFHRLRSNFPDGSGSHSSIFSRSYNTATAVTATVWAPSISIATTLDIDTFFLFLPVLRCFSSRRSPLVNSRCTAFNRTGCPIQISPDQFLFADPRGFSQLTTSFVASRSQGILRSLLFSYLE